MASHDIVIVLSERDQRLVELAATDGDAAAALDFVRQVVKPQMDRALKSG